MKANNPIFKLLKQSEKLKALLQFNQTFKVFMAGLAPDNAQLPYVIWQNISRNPLNTFSDSPTADEYLVQIDVYAKDMTTAQNIASEIESVLEVDYRVRGSLIEQDYETKNYRIMLEVEMLILRTE